MDNTSLRFYDVVPGGVLSLCVWHYDGWTDLVVAAVEGDPSKVFSCFFEGMFCEATTSCEGKSVFGMNI